MIKLIDLLRENRQAVIGVVDFESKRNFAKSPKGRILAKIRKDIELISSDEELYSYLKQNFLDKSKSWESRLLFGKLLDAFEGKKK